MKSAYNHPRPSARGRLMRGAGVAALLLAAPVAAQAADECGPLVEGQVTCPADGDYSDKGISYVVDPAERQDLTINLPDGMTLVTDGDLGIGLHAANLNGSVNIVAGGAHVVTSGNSATGLSAATYIGDIRIDVASVTTTGDSAHGIVTSASDGDIEINVGSVSTSGWDAYGITALADAPHVGTVKITADTITTQGEMADGVNVFSLGEGGVTVDVGTVSTAADWAFGLNVTGDGNVTLSADSITTQGAFGYGVSAVAWRDVDIKVGQVSTAGDNAMGVAALSWTGGASVEVDKVTTSGVGGVGVYVETRLGDGVARVRANSVSTAGESADGVNVSTQSGTYDIAVKEVKTAGQAARGVVAVGAAGDSEMVVERVETTGEYATGVYTAIFGGTGLTTIGSVQTSGDRAEAAWVGSLGGTVDQVSGNLTTTGDRSAGIQTRGVFGDVGVDSRGAIRTSGDGSHGIAGFSFFGVQRIKATGAISTSGDGSHGIYMDSRDSDVSIAASQIDTSGAGAHGIKVDTMLADFVIFADQSAPKGPPVKPDDKGHVLPGVGQDGGYGTQGGGFVPTPKAIDGTRLDIVTGTVRVRGDGALGMLIDTDGELAIDAGVTTSADAEAIKAKARGLAALKVRTAAASAKADAVSLTGADVSLDVAAGAEIRGAVNGVVLEAVGPYVPPPVEEGPWLGRLPEAPTVTVTNAGAIRGGTGYALVVKGGDASVVNTGRIEGPISLAGGDDLIDNRGAFLVDRDSEFGAGDDLFVNSGVVGVEGDVVFAGLETFHNKGGVIDLQNGRAGDSLTLSGDYQASGDARLALDVSLTGGASDRLVVTGEASGETALVLANVKAAEARLAAPGEIKLIELQGGGTATFVIDESSQDIGFLRYGLRYDAATDSYRLANTAGAAVRRSLKAGEGAQSAWLASADGWAAELASRRDGGDAGRVWAQVYGTSEERDEVRTVVADGGEETFDLGYEQDAYGAQMGVDLGERAVAGGMVRFGLTGGYLETAMTFAGADRLEAQTLNLGGYAAFGSGRAFADVLVKYDLHSFGLTGAGGLSDEFQGGTLGVQSQAGVRFGSERLFVEPVVRLGYASTSLDAVEALDQRLEFDDRAGWIVQAGVRVGGERELAAGRRVSFYAGGDLGRELDGETGLTFVSGGLSERVEDDGPTETVVRGVLGASLALPVGVTLQVEGTGASGDDRSGAGLRFGARFNF